MEEKVCSNENFIASMGKSGFCVPSKARLDLKFLPDLTTVCPPSAVSVGKGLSPCVSVTGEPK
jgi:hypothetical protein